MADTPEIKVTQVETTTPTTTTTKTSKPASVVIATATEVTSEAPVVEGTFVSAKGDEFVKGYIQQYLDILKLGNPDRTIAAFSSIVRYVLKNTTDDNMTCLFTLFKTYKDTILNERVALQGITTLPGQERNKVEIMYCMLRELSTDKRKQNMDRVRSVLGDKVVTWVAKQK